jgi:hypothetical protein
MFCFWPLKFPETRDKTNSFRAGAKAGTEKDEPPPEQPATRKIRNKHGTILKTRKKLESMAQNCIAKVLRLAASILHKIDRPSFEVRLICFSPLAMSGAA